MEQKEEKNVKKNSVKPKKKKSMKSKIRIVVMLIALGVFTYAAYELTTIYLEYKEGRESYNAVEQLFMQVPSGEQVEETDREGKVIKGNVSAKFVWDYSKLLEINKEGKGWIRLEDIISYPIVQHSDNDYYLHHTVQNEPLSVGSIFIDYRVKKGLDDSNCILYGHNMNDDSMFGKLEFFVKDADYVKKHNVFDVYIEDRHYKYYVFAVYESNEKADTYTCTFKKKKDFIKYCEKSVAKSMYDIEVKFDGWEGFNKDTKVLTLSTCNNARSSYRYVVQLVRGERLDEKGNVIPETTTAKKKKDKKDTEEQTKQEETTKQKEAGDKKDEKK